jgi:RsiW-degrading membrane proteinase PrsW (M82 family)
MSQDEDHSIENEPHLQKNGAGMADALSETSRVEHTVWDEPALNPAARDQMPSDAITYARWLERKIEERSELFISMTPILVALVAGPLAILGTLFNGSSSYLGVLNLTVFGPATEEIMKVAGLLWIVEKQPFRFTSRLQILLCACAGGLAFGVIENLIYLNIYIENPPDSLVYWRWTVCTALHGGCSIVAGLGIMRVWKITMVKREKPRLAHATPYLVTAFVLHAAYNSFCLLLSIADFQF